MRQVRLQPFSSHAVQFQGDRFDHPDRLFQSVRQSWMSASGGLSADPSTQTSNMQDVKELIPEFFYLPEFLCNLNKYDFGTTPSGAVVNDVELPPWANGSPTLFIQKHRAALESEHVSRHLHLWIDLIFGYKQTGEEALKACNAFKFLTYANDIDITQVENEAQKAAYIAEICNFGQTPTQLFRKRHPPRRCYNGRDLNSQSTVSATCNDTSGGVSPSMPNEPQGQRGSESFGEWLGDENVTCGLSLGRSTPLSEMSDESLPSKDSRPSVSFSTDDDVAKGGDEHEDAFDLAVPPECVAGTASLLSVLKEETFRYSPSAPCHDLLQSLSRCDAPPSFSYYDGVSLDEVRGLNILDGQLVANPFGTLVLPVPGKYIVLLGYGYVDCTFKVLASPMDEPEHRESGQHPAFAKPAYGKSSSVGSAGVSEKDTGVSSGAASSGKLLRGFGSRDKMRPGSPSDMLGNGSSVVYSESKHLDVNVDGGVSSKRWKVVTSFDVPGSSISCAVSGGLAEGHKMVVITGHRLLGVVQLWVVDLQAIATAAALSFSCTSASVPNGPMRAIVLLQTYHSPWHDSGGITSIATCLNGSRLLASTGSFATCCGDSCVVIWDYCYSADSASVLPVAKSYRGVCLYPVERPVNSRGDAALDGGISLEGTDRRECVHHVAFDSGTSDLYVSLGLRVIVFDINCRIKAAAEFAAGLNTAGGDNVFALCTGIVHVLEWECFRAFLVGYSDGSVCMWAMRHWRDSCFTSSSLPLAYDDMDMQPHESFSIGNNCVPSGAVPIADPTRSVSGFEKLLRLVRLKWTARGSRKHYSHSPPTTEVTQRSGGSLQVATEYVCFPVLRVSSGGGGLPITSVRMSPDWSCILAGRSDGSVVSWTIF